MQKSMTQILQETIDHIKTNGRCMEDGLCCYWTDDTEGHENMCAVGRWMKNPMEAQENTFPPIEDLTLYSDDGNLYEREGYDVIVDELEEQLIPEVQGHPTYFWDLLQNFHDIGWKDKEMTFDGPNILDQLCNAMSIDRNKITT